MWGNGAEQGAGLTVLVEHSVPSSALDAAAHSALLKRPLTPMNPQCSSLALLLAFTRVSADLLGSSGTAAVWMAPRGGSCPCLGHKAFSVHRRGLLPLRDDGVPQGGARVLPPLWLRCTGRMELQAGFAWLSHVDPGVS